MLSATASGQVSGDGSSFGLNLNSRQVSSECVVAAVRLGAVIGVKVIEDEVKQLPTIAAVARHIGVNKTHFYNFATRKCGLQSKRPCERISDEKETQIKELLTDSQLSIGEIAKTLGVSRKSVSMRNSALRRQEMIEASEESEFVRKEHRCEVHGIVAFSPCPACAAKRAVLENRERAVLARQNRLRMEERK